MWDCSAHCYISLSIWECDWCDRRITKSRFLCIQCMAEDLSDNINLCSTCLDRSPLKRGFTHDMSHDMVKVEETLHDFHFAQVVESARTTISRVKGIFRTLESYGAPSNDDITASVQTRVGEEERIDPICACCTKRVTTPCWACVVCSTFSISYQVTVQFTNLYHSTRYIHLHRLRCEEATKSAGRTFTGTQTQPSLGASP